MREFLVIDKKPIIKWQQIPPNTYFRGNIPEGYKLAVSPGDGYIVIDVDRHEDKDGFKNIPNHILLELEKTLNYITKNNGMHFWFKYTGDVTLGNKTSGLGIDLRVANKGYVVWYKEDKRISECIDEINETSEELNKWLILLFKTKTNNEKN